ncbi:MAG: DNA polymerase ligase N-terminal domain-containing protein [Planctomycetota bacterium]|jgi:hypothetical protein
MCEFAGQFVILRHEGWDSLHWDLMFDMGDVLATWQFPANPCPVGAGEVKYPLRVSRLPDHRRAYLDYEGPLSGDRGMVRRVDGGRYTLEERSSAVWTVRMAGRLLSGRYQLTLVAGADAVWEWHRLDG